MSTDINAMFGAGTNTGTQEVAGATPVAAAETNNTQVFAGFADAFSKIDVNSLGSNDGLPIGEYKARVSEIKLKLTKTNQPLAQVQFTVIDGPKVNKKQSQSLFLLKKDGDANTVSVGQLASIYQIVFGLPELEAKTKTLTLLQGFMAQGGKEIVMGKELPQVAGNMTIVNDDWTNPTTNALVKKNKTTFKAA